MARRACAGKKGLTPELERRLRSSFRWAARALGGKNGSVGRGEPREASKRVGTYVNLAMGQGWFGNCCGLWNVCL